ncbi:hypothetical protein, partial [Pseudomonas canadensis]|uniref:hypothetical protein n=1 Tax=Pseudomonas canadensis TaxID=915099 RepID=UPI0030DC116F
MRASTLTERAADRVAITTCVAIGPSGVPALALCHESSCVNRAGESCAATARLAIERETTIRLPIGSGQRGLASGNAAGGER